MTALERLRAEMREFVAYGRSSTSHRLLHSLQTATIRTTGYYLQSQLMRPQPIPYPLFTDYKLKDS
jgi:hypothetical protein